MGVPKTKKVLVLVPLCAVLVSSAAFLQHWLVLKTSISARNFVIPLLVGSSFGYLLGRVLDLRSQVNALNAELQELLGKKAIALDQTKAQLAQAQKMTTLGQLAAGVAHDFNNLLTAIMSGASMAQLLSPDKASRELLEDVISSTESGATLTQQILAFGRPSSQEKSIVAVDEVVDHSLPTLKLVLSGAHQLKRSGSCDGARAEVLEGQLEQTLMNLVINARDATPDGGVIEIVTSLDDTRSSLVLQVSDEGCGMPPELIEKVLTPFFTTKSDGNGTGLGLSIVQNLVEKSKGSLTIESELGAGTTVKVSLPIAA